MIIKIPNHNYFFNDNNIFSLRFKTVCNIDFKIHPCKVIIIIIRNYYEKDLDQIDSMIMNFQ